ncbi:hypothetical protein SOVF_153910, partial [Spinacia oleracea]
MATRVNNIYSDHLEADSSRTIEEESDEPEILEELPAKQKRRGGKKSRDVNERGKRKRTSNAWDHFDVIATDIDHAKCIYYGSKITCSATKGFNAMLRHTDRRNKAQFNIDKKKTNLDFESRTVINTDGTVET